MATAREKLKAAGEFNVTPRKNKTKVKSWWAQGLRFNKAKGKFE